MYYSRAVEVPQLSTEGVIEGQWKCHCRLVEVKTLPASGRQ